MRNVTLWSCAFVLALSASGQPGDPREAGVLDLRRSPYAKLRSVPVRAVTMRDGFWSARQKVNVERSIPTLLDLLEEHGVLDNFRRLSGRKPAARRGPLYTDSDIYKWLEAAAFVLQSGDRPDLRAKVDRVVEEILAAQEPSGYLNTYYVDERKALRFTEVTRGHETYCLGHLLQAAIALHRAGGDRRLLDAGIRFVNYLMDHFGRAKRPLSSDHPEIELALVELYRTTGDRRHLEFAAYFLEGDGERLKLTPRDIVYLFSGKPFTERTKLEGHAVRAMYAASGATDYYLETGEEAYWKTLERLWEDLTRRKMYITGGVGSRAVGEAFGEPYELPNQLAYTESCAAIGNLMWNWRMLAATGEARFADVLERALYNGVNSGMSLDGTLYCYRNPLELVGNPEDRIRNPWYSTTCCPPNLERILASLPGYFYSTSREGLYVHLYDNNQLHWRLENGVALRLRQATRYPWDGQVRIEVQPASATEFTLFLRIPAWSRRTRVTVNGVGAGPAQPGTYLALRRSWKPGDTVTLEMDGTPRFTMANPRVRDSFARVAIERGPLVYAMEQIDQKGAGSLFDLYLDLEGGKSRFQQGYVADKLGGIVELRHAGLEVEPRSATRPLYEPFAADEKVRGRPRELVLIPYYAFANREPTAMTVWIPYRR